MFTLTLNFLYRAWIKEAQWVTSLYSQTENVIYYTPIEKVLQQKLQWVTFWKIRKSRRMKIWNSCWFENLNSFFIFFVFQLYIDLRCYHWSLQTLSLVLLWSTGLWLEREGIAFFFHKLGWHRREKVAVEVFTHFSDLSALSLQLVTSYLTFWTSQWSVQKKL